ncbi:hypothetical protein ABZ590_37055 [Streptomyces hirsutus]|uniref:hypothetical protein n=1 Tax=Streptomyces hirsutus TaxID=35620 RepID=UPI0033FEEED0
MRCSAVDRVDDPSEDALFMVISGLDDSGNTFVAVQPDEDDHVRSASVAVLVEGGYGIVRRDGTRGEHKVTTSTGVNGIARDLGVWRAARHPLSPLGRPTGRLTDFPSTV